MATPDKPRNVYGLGSVFQRQSDGRWCATINLPPGPDGKRRRKLVYAATEDVVRKLQAEEQRRVARGQSATGRQLVGDFLEEWLRVFILPRLDGTTYINYRASVRHHLVPHLGGVRLARLNAEHVDSCYSALLAAGYARATIQKTHNILRQAIDQAVRWGRLPSNPVRLVRPPPLERKRPPTLSAEDGQRLLAALHGWRDEALWVVALTAGLRLGELLGLLWQSVDLEAGTLSVVLQAKRVEGEGLALRAPKTPHSRRTFDLTPMAVAALMRHRQAQRVARLQHGAAWQDGGLVFPGQHGKLRYAAVVRISWYRFLKRHGLPRIHPHGLRHVAASTLLALGVPVPEVAEQMGHASAAVTMAIYAHVIPGRRSAAAEQAERYWNPPAEATNES